MNVIAISELKQLKVAEVRTLLPVMVTADGEPLGFLAKPEDVIVIGDLHPRVRNRLRALEKRARIGMPKHTETYASLIKEQ